MTKDTSLIQGRYQDNTTCQDILRQYGCGNQLYKLCNQFKQNKIALKYHFAREHITDNVVEITKVDTEDNYADPLTKTLIVSSTMTSYKIIPGTKSMLGTFHLHAHYYMSHDPVCFQVKDNH